MALIKAKKTTWNAERGLVILYDDNPQHGVIMPIDALGPLAAHARRVVAGEQARKGQTSVVRDWRYAHPLKADTFALETMPNDAGDQVILSIDPKSDVETSYAMDRATARALGRRLIEVAEEASPPASSEAG
jgi:hypothetical protein